MPVRAATPADLDWICTVFARRRTTLVEHAPVFWRPAPDATVRSREFIAYLLRDGGAVAYRTNTAVLIAAPRGDGWLVDDMYVPGDRWSAHDGRELWNALVSAARGADVRFVSPTYEHHRAEFARAAGLTVAESWWLRELDAAGGEAGLHVHLRDTEAITVPAPPVYAPPGPILFLPGAPSDAPVVISAAVEKATTLGCAGVVVNVRPEADELATALHDEGFRRHCDYYTGTIDEL